MKLAKPDHKVLAQEKHKQELVESGELRRVCENIDVDGDRMITSEEFVAAYQTNKKLRAHFAVLGLDISDAKVFFDTLAGDDDAPEIDIEVFIKHCMRLKGAATSIDLHHFQVENRLACRRQQEFIERCGGRIERLAARVAHLAAVLHRREQGSSARDFEHGHHRRRRQRPTARGGATYTRIRPGASPKA
ncbi:unnamed protein product [Prorocentrum cordatum]|uniref:EF-hand domain-containing protein n=1 Tax=Prorocentrum cordatum TaxID=2364126 RepID=A0ABN9TGF8_9DINO|nr:unnamed protein product [Polarella glacialis]